LELELLLGIPEYKVYLDNKKAPSQNDLFILCSSINELVVVMIEGKVDESFDKLIHEWNSLNSSRVQRLKFLTDKLEIPPSENIDNYRYQLLHRTASAIITAEKFHAAKAIMLVHSFSETGKWFEDFSSFVKLVNPQIEPFPNVIYNCRTLSSGVELSLGWIVGDKIYLDK
jgi:hypothetical protein